MILLMVYSNVFLTTLNHKITVSATMPLTCNLNLNDLNNICSNDQIKKDKNISYEITKEDSTITIKF